MKNLKLYYRKLIRFWQRLGRKRRQRYGLIAVCIFVVILLLQGMNQTVINPTAYKSLLETIAKGESNGNYNAYFGSVNNTSVRFTDMTVAKVVEWQKNYVAQGNASNAVGRYQFMGTTLEGLIRQLRIDPNVRFNEALQDRLAIALIERRGAVAFVQEKITREQFAENLSKEWAALPRTTGPNPTQSYYAGDGLNASRVSIQEVFQALAKLKEAQ